MLHYTEIYNVTGHYACNCFNLPLEFDSLYSQVRMLGTECDSTACVFKISISCNNSMKINNYCLEINPMVYINDE